MTLRGIAPSGGGGGAGIGGIAAGTQTFTSGTLSFDNAGGISFGLNNGTITAQAPAAAPSPVIVSGANGSSVSANSIVFSNSNGITLGVSTAAGGATITASYTQSGQAFSAPGGSSTFSTLVFANSNGVSFTNSNGSLVASVQTNYLTTARASNDGIGLNTAQTNVTWTVNSSGISLNAGGYAGTGTSATNASVTLNSNGIAISVAAPGAGGTATAFAASNTTQSSSGTFALSSIVFAGAGIASVGVTNGSVVISVPSGGGAGDGGNTLAAGTRTATSSGAVLFSDSNGVSWGLNAVNGTQMTLQHELQYTSQTSAITSNALNTSASRVINLVAATNSTAGGAASLSGNVSFSANNGITFYTSAGNAIVGSVVTSYRASNDAIGLNTAQTNVTWTVNSSGISLNAGGYAGTGYTSTTTAGVNIVATHNTAGLSLAFPTIITNAITTARASNDAIGLNTAQTNVTWTVNSSGLSLNAAGYAGTGTSATNASITLNSNGLAISVAAPGGGGAGNFNLLAPNTSGNTTATGNTIGLSGLNLTLSGTNNSQIVISAPATSSLSATGILSISKNGSTISLGVPGQTNSLWVPGFIEGQASTGSPLGNGSVFVFPAQVSGFINVSRANHLASFSLSSSTNSSHAGAVSIYFGIYTLNGSTLSLASSGSGSYQWTNTSSNSQNSLTGIRMLTAGINATLTPGDYWVGMMSRTTSTNAAWFTIGNNVLSNFSAQLQGQIGEVSNNTKQWIPGFGMWTTTSMALPASMALSQINGRGASSTNAFFMPQINFVNYTA